MDYYSEIRRNELLSHEKTWRNCKYISRGEICQSEKATCLILGRVGRWGERLSGVQGKGGTNTWSMGDLWGRDTVMLTFVKTHRSYNPKSEP